MKYNLIDYKEKYFKYKKKYLQLKNNIYGSAINPSDIDKFQIADMHGTLNLDNMITIPSNVYLILSNFCGLVNYDSLINIFTDKQTQNSYNLSEIIRNFEKSDKYTLIKPNTEICDIVLSGSKEDFSIFGLFDYNPEINIMYYHNIISGRTDDYIKSKMENFMKKYGKDYKDNLEKLKENYNFDILNVYKREQFDFIYLLGFIVYIKKKIDNLSLQKEGILTKGKINYDDKGLGTANYNDYNNFLTPDAISDINLFDNISQIIINSSNISNELMEITNKLGANLKNTINVKTIGEFNIVFNEYIRDFNFTYFELFMIIYSYIFIEYSEAFKYAIPINTLLQNISSVTKKDKYSIIFVPGCLQPMEIDKYNKITLYKKQEMCHNRMANIPDYHHILNKITSNTNIYNILLNKTTIIFNTINDIVNDEYNITVKEDKNKNDLFFIVIIVILLFFGDNTNIDEMLRFNDYILNKIYVNDDTDLDRLLISFCKLIFILYKYGNKNITNFIDDTFKEIYVPIKNFIANKSKINQDILEEQILQILKTIYLYDDVKNMYILQNKYILFTNLLIFSINYFYINKILNIDKILSDNVSANDLLSEINYNGFIYFNIKHEYLIDKIKKDNNGHRLYLYDIYFNNNNTFNISQKEILPNSNEDEDENYIYILQDDYNEIIKNIFTLYFTL